MAWQIRERAIHQPQQTPIVAAEFDIGGKHSQHAPKRKRRVLAKRTADDTRGHGPSAARGAPLPPARDTSSRYAQASFRPTASADISAAKRVSARSRYSCAREAHATSANARLSGSPHGQSMPAESCPDPTSARNEVMSVTTAGNPVASASMTEYPLPSR